MSQGFEQVDAGLADAIASGALPGVVAVVVGPEGVRHTFAGGRLSVDGGADVTADTMFRLASMTKAVASVAALQLVEAGRLELDAEVASILPEHGELQVLDGFDGDTPRLRAPASRATVRQLMNHTAGHTYHFANTPTVRYLEVTGTPNVLTGDVAALHAPLVADPGTTWEYGTNTDWLGKVVEAVSGQDLKAYLQEHILDPLGMTDTTFSPGAEQRERMMAVHHRTPDGSLVAGPVDLNADPGWWAGGHGLHGTAGDYGRFVAALLGGGELDGTRILGEETLRLMFDNSLGDIALPELMKSADPDLMNDVPTMPWKQGWGLGLHLTLEDLPGMRSAGTGDWAGLFNSYYWIDRSAGVGGVVLTQVLPFFDEGVVTAAVGFEMGVYAAVGAGTASAA